MKKFISVAGNIGAGKSSLVRFLAQRLGWQPFFEPVVANPYLADFYEQMSVWGFHSQVFFLAQRLKMHRELLLFPGSVIQDRSIYEDADIFAENLYQQGHLSRRDYETYRSLYQSLSDFLPPPDLVIYLRATVSTLVQRISLRNRDYERAIDPAYLAQLNELYERWIANFVLCPVLTIPADNLNFVQNPHHLDLIVLKVKEKLTGKEEVIFAPGEFSSTT